jgi:acyl-coenzyme A thioesterase PaaI-like protein
MRSRLINSVTPTFSCRHFSKLIDSQHTAFLTAMYKAAPVCGIFNQHNITFDAETGNTTLHFTPDTKHCHTAGSLHGSGYFKLLDDASFFAAQAHITDNFIFTVSFNTYFIKAVVPGTPWMGY